VNLSKRHLLTTALSLALCGAAGVAHAQDALSNIEKTKVVRIGIPTDYPPYGFVGIDMQPQGLDVDMARYIASKMGVKVELVPVTSPNRIPYLQSHKVDLVISTLGKNPEREKVIDFSAAYSPYFQAVYGPKSMKVKTAADLGGKTIAATRGAIEDQEVTRIAPASAQIKRFEDNNATVAAYVAHQTELLATGASVAEVMMQRNPALNTEFKLLLKESPNHIGLAKGEAPLLAKVNEIIAQAKTAGDLDKLSQKWLKRPAGNLPQ
jgi:polar amino acid transport system substrate-binding protein